MSPVAVGVVIGVVVVLWLSFSPGLRKQRAEQAARIVCPYCQTQGSVSVQNVRRKVGISGGKATGAVFTGGLSVLATGLSRKESGQRLACRNCGVQWNA